MSSPENPKLVELLTGELHPMLIYELQRYLQGQWPQFNAKTTIQTADHYRLQLATWPGVRQHDDHVPAPRQGAKARFWRVAGELFNKRLWVQKGMYLMPVLPQPMVREVEFKRFGMKLPFTRLDVPMDSGADFVIICGYDALTDTLFVWRYQTVGLERLAKNATDR